MDEIGKNRISHLEMIQTVISRIANNSNATKRYSLILTAAAVSYMKWDQNPQVGYFAAALLVVFALLDANYLRLERGFRELFNEIRKEPEDKRIDFRMNPQTKRSLFHSLFSWSVGAPHVTLIILVLAATFVKGAPE